MFGILKHIFGTQQTRLLKKYHKMVRLVNIEEQKLADLTDQQLKAKTAEFKERIAQGETLDQLLPEAYAVVKNACRRLCGTEVHVSGYNQKWDMIPYDVQILGAIAMHYGAIAEMQTGEGKTLTASMPLYLNALTGKPVHSSLSTITSPSATANGSATDFPLARPHESKRLTNSTPHHKRKESMQPTSSMEQLLNSASIICATTRWRKAKKTSASAATILPSSTKSTRS